MSIVAQIAFLEQISSLDGEIRRIDEQLDKHRSGLEGLRTEIKGLEDRLKADRSMVAEMDKTRGELVTEIRQMGQQIERSREKLQRCRNEREQNAATREIEELRKLHRDREDELERLNLAADSARTGIDDAEGKRKGLQGTVDGTQAGVASDVKQLETERATLAATRAQVMGKLPGAIYRRYESIKTRRPVAIARTIDGTCLGCHVSVPPMMFQKMRRREEFEQCPNCRRILYYMPPEAASRDPEGEGPEPASPGSRA